MTVGIYLFVTATVAVISFGLGIETQKHITKRNETNDRPSTSTI